MILIIFAILGTQSTEPLPLARQRRWFAALFEIGTRRDLQHPPKLLDVRLGLLQLA